MKLDTSDREILSVGIVTFLLLIGLALLLGSLNTVKLEGPAGGPGGEPQIRLEVE